MNCRCYSRTQKMNQLLTAIHDNHRHIHFIYYTDLVNCCDGLLSCNSYHITDSILLHNNFPSFSKTSSHFTPHLGQDYNKNCTFPTFIIAAHSSADSFRTPHHTTFETHHHHTNNNCEKNNNPKNRTKIVIDSHHGCEKAKNHNPPWKDAGVAPDLFSKKERIICEIVSQAARMATLWKRCVACDKAQSRGGRV